MAEQLFEVPEPDVPVSAAALLDAVAAEEQAERRHAAAKLEAILAWAHAHPVGGDTSPASWAADRSMFLPWRRVRTGSAVRAPHRSPSSRSSSSPPG